MKSADLRHRGKFLRCDTSNIRIRHQALDARLAETRDRSNKKGETLNKKPGISSASLTD